jgi:hypothetical protein
MFRQIESLVEDKYVYRMKLNAAEEQKSNLQSELCRLKSIIESVKGEIRRGQTLLDVDRVYDHLLDQHLG